MCLESRVISVKRHSSLFAALRFVLAVVLRPIAYQVSDFRHERGKHGLKIFFKQNACLKKCYQAAQNEDNHKCFAEAGLTCDISVANSTHCDNKKVDAFPVGNSLRILEVLKRITAVLELQERFRLRGKIAFTNELSEAFHNRITTPNQMHKAGEAQPNGEENRRQIREPVC